MITCDYEWTRSLQTWSFCILKTTIYVEQMNTAYALYKGFWEVTEKAPILRAN